jgi:hypothetical protein
MMHSALKHWHHCNLAHRQLEFQTVSTVFRHWKLSVLSRIFSSKRTLKVHSESKRELFDLWKAFASEVALDRRAQALRPVLLRKFLGSSLIRAWRERVQSKRNRLRARPVVELPRMFRGVSQNLPVMVMNRIDRDVFIQRYRTCPNLLCLWTFLGMDSRVIS